MSDPDIHTEYRNKSLADLPGEVWKDVPGFEGYYQASNLGRIKSLDRTIPHPRLKTQFVKGRVLSQSVFKNKNLLTGEPMVDLRVTLLLENKYNYFNTRRLIYQAFIDPKLDYKLTGLYVINVDANGYNNRPENLKLVSKKEKQQRVIARNRMTHHLSTADRSGWKKSYATSKPVAQYDLDGNLVKEFRSIKEASRELRLSDKAIIDVAKGIYKQWNGFVWKYIDKE
ncbi:hypothetical protein FMM05_11580 [Flavobacterium zepuense]|uniref:NUMOD4 domain-containing protein n=1 Tax=Flavobacterium zepuense TaxID=2593302 RepID=A0A552V043_9FLAO|nr:NUMOD4 domain-containing protein [Flavobacterium zepuense]TRW23800.1 hypothetical protein FMM05_11580 [Flavobacterium zepuense]